jgi:hypothetical protein
MLLFSNCVEPDRYPVVGLTRYLGTTEYAMSPPAIARKE